MIISVSTARLNFNWLAFPEQNLILIFQKVFVVELDVGGVDVVQLDAVHVLRRRGHVAIKFKRQQ